MRDGTTRWIVLLSFVFLVIRVVSMVFVAQPGYTDAFYYLDVAVRLARGDGLSADFLWSPIEAPGLPPLPVASHRFWMPLATAVQALGIALLGAPLGDVRAAQVPLLLVAALVPWLTWRAARSLGATGPAALVAAGLTGLGGILAPAWVTLDGFGLAAVLGTAFFLWYARAAAGDVRSGALTGLAVGALFLARAEGSLFGVALLVLAWRPVSRRAGVAGAAAAFAIGVAWLVRGALLPGGGGEVLARSALLVRYEDLFALRQLCGSCFLAALDVALPARLDALGRNALTLLGVTGVVLLPLAVAGARSGWRLPHVRTFALLAGLVFVAESLVWTLHSVRGSYAHSLAAFVPFGAALAVTGGASLLRPEHLRPAALAGLAAWAFVSSAAVTEWPRIYDPPALSRAAALSAIPEGPFLAADAAAWRWSSGRPVLVTPADGLLAAGCLVTRYGARALVLEASPRFSAYDGLYRGTETALWLGPPVERGTVKVFPVTGAPPPCS